MSDKQICGTEKQLIEAFRWAKRQWLLRDVLPAVILIAPLIFLAGYVVGLAVGAP